MRLSFVALTWLVVSLTSLVAQAQTDLSVRAGEELMIGPFGTDEIVVKVDTKEKGEAFITQDQTRFFYVAPTAVDGPDTLDIDFTLANKENLESKREVTRRVSIEPKETASGVAAAVAFEMLFLLLIFALFIEAAVVSLTAILRAGQRWWLAGQPPQEDGTKPSVYKAVYAAILAALVVVPNELAPLTEIIKAAGDGREPDNPMLPWADYLVTILVLAGGAESVRRIAVGIQEGLKVPTAATVETNAARQDTGQTTA